jgi:fatty acid desaturase
MIPRAPRIVRVNIVSVKERDTVGEAPGEQGPSNDIPVSLKGTLVDDRGVPYRDFRRTLEPRWGRVWLELGAGYAVIVAVLAGLVAWDPGWPMAVIGAIAGGLVTGYTIQFINCFFHEAAHYNVVPGRSRNDLVANVLMGWLFGSSISLYRKIHWQHHRALGTTMDSENSYFDALGVRYLVEGLLGLKLLRTLREHQATEASMRDSGPGDDERGHRLAWLGLSAAVNLALAALLWILGSPAAAIAWLIGLLAVFPFLASLRTVLEHRAEDADPEVDYHRTDQGPVNRLFGTGPIANTIGSAGFNRHAIHHWEPQLSYTRLADVEAYLLRTEAAPLVRERQTSYAQTFLRLLEL